MQTSDYWLPLGLSLCLPYTQLCRPAVVVSTLFSSLELNGGLIFFDNTCVQRCVLVCKAWFLRLLRGMMNLERIHHLLFLSPGMKQKLLLLTQPKPPSPCSSYICPAMTHLLISFAKPHFDSVPTTIAKNRMKCTSNLLPIFWTFFETFFI